MSWLRSLRRIVAGRAVIGAFVVLVGPFLLGVYDNTLMTPLALPGYVVLSIGSSIGNTIFPNLALWVFWVPFFGVFYLIAIGIGGLYRTVRH